MQPGGTSTCNDPAPLLDRRPSSMGAEQVDERRLTTQWLTHCIEILTLCSWYFSPWWLHHFVNQFHLFMLISAQLSLLLFLHPSLLHSFTLISNVTFSVNPFRHRSLTIVTQDWYFWLMGPFSVSALLIGFSSLFVCGRLKWFSSFSTYIKIVYLIHSFYDVTLRTARLGTLTRLVLVVPNVITLLF